MSCRSEKYVGEVKKKWGGGGTGGSSIGEAGSIALAPDGCEVQGTHYEI